MPKVKTPPTVQPWHMRSGETFRTFALFNQYLEMGDERSLGKVAEESGRRYQLIAILSSKFTWRERAIAYDAHLAQKQIEAIEHQLEKDAITHAKRKRIYIEREHTVAGKLLAKAEEMLDAPLYETKVDKIEIINGQEVVTHYTIKPVRWNYNTAAQMVRISADIHRLHFEMETSRAVVKVENPAMEDEKVRLVKARAVLEKLYSELDSLVDETMTKNPTMDRAQVEENIISYLPRTVAKDWNLSEDKIPLLLEGTKIHKLVDGDSLPFPGTESEAVN